MHSLQFPAYCERTMEDVDLTTLNPNNFNSCTIIFFNLTILMNFDTQENEKNLRFTGFIQHRLHYPTSVKDMEISSNIVSQKPKLKRKLGMLENSCIDDGNSYIGFYFINANDKDKSVDGIRLISPQSMVKIVCDIARFRSKVAITKCSVVRWTDNDDSSSIGEIKFIELHHGGLLIPPDFPLFEPRCRTLPTMSLSEVQKLEQNLFLERERMKIEKTLKEKKKGIAQKYFSIRGKVDAISSIIAIVPTDLFAMIEIYDPYNPSISTVIILKGKNALTCQPAIIPGDNLILHNIIRSRWHVPQSFQKDDIPIPLHSRAPSHVWVVTDPLSIQWDSPFDADFLKRQHCSTMNSELYRNIPILPPLPCTIQSLYSIRGKVTSIKYAEMQQSRQPHRLSNSIVYVHLENQENDESKRHYKLYLLYYPMSPDLQFGLEVGAHISAINVHKISLVNYYAAVQELGNCNPNYYEVYGACLRSTVTVLVHASDKVIKDREHKRQVYNLLQRRKPTISLTKMQDNFYIFSSVTYSYIEYEWMSQIKLNLFNNIKASPEVFRAMIKCLFENKYHRNVNISRDPYKEWFFHACDNETSTCHDKERDLRLCSPVSTNLFPIIFNASKLMSKCMDVMKDTLFNQPQFSSCPDAQSAPAKIGSTHSILFNPRQLAKLYRSDDNCNILKVYLGGIIAETSHYGDVVCQIHDESSQIPLVPIRGKRHSKKQFVLGDFVLIQIKQVAVSSFYLGKHKMERIDQSDNPVKTYSLPPSLTPSAKVRFGPCQLCICRGHLFLLSVQAHYYLTDLDSLAKKTKIIETNVSTDMNVSELLESSTNSNDKCAKIGVLTKLIHKVEEPILDEVKCKCSTELFVGRLVRLNWKPRKLRVETFTGCSITLSFLPMKNDEAFRAAGVLQSVDLVLPLPIASRNIDIMRNSFELWSSFKVSEDILSLACGWRVLAEQSNTCLLLIDNSASPKQLFTTKVYVSLPSKYHKKYIVNFVQANLENLSEEEDLQSDMSSCTELMPSNVVNMLPGVLDKRLNRAVIRSNQIDRVGELVLPAENFHGLPSLTISTLMYRLYNDLSCRQLECQLDFRVASAQLSKLKFCSVRIQCTNCFQFLTYKYAWGQNSNSFWDRPLPIDSETEKMAKAKDRRLVCPNGCGYCHAAVKWELSGLVEDGTGVAKLYAERDAALLLLGEGLDTSVIQFIEEGAWLSSKGIVFQRGVPLRSHLQSNCLKNLSALERATVALYHHCLKSRNFRRKRFDLICSFKKILNTKKQVLNRFEMALTSALGQNGKVIQLSYDSVSAPIIELQLVDCIRCLETPADISWSITKLL